MRKTDLAYYAGIFDGEGCVQISYQITGRGRKYYSYRLRCIIANTNEWLIQSLKMAFGGSIYKIPAKGNRRDCWQWRISSIQASTFIKSIYPYLRLKKPEADLALKFQGQRKYPGRKGLTDEQWAVQEAQKLMMQNLKK